jgi:predicted PurR-regulated permease PerM
MNNNAIGKDVTGKALETVIKIGVVIGLAIWCFLILRPFVLIFLWGLIIAVAVYKSYDWVRSKMGGRKKLAACIVIGVFFLCILLPLFLMRGTLYEGIAGLKGLVSAESLTIPPPPETIIKWPLIGKPLFNIWKAAADNLESTIMQFTPQIKMFLTWLLSNVAAAGIGILEFILSIIISAFFLVNYDSGDRFVREFTSRLAGDRGEELVNSAAMTVRSVMRGILGVALIQSLLIGVGFVIAGVPGAGLWILLCFILSVIQIGPLPVVLGVLIYMFLKATTFAAIALTVWCIIISPLDNILKPILLGRGTKTPTLVIFLGSIGGFMLSGIIGLFTGAVILTLGYNLFLIWLRESE